MNQFNKVTLAVLGVSLMMLNACEDLVPHDPVSILFHSFHRSEIVGMLAGFGTTFAAVPDLIAMLRVGQVRA